MRESLAPVLCGLAMGVAGAIALGQSIEGMLFQISTHDPATLTCAGLLLLAAAAAASCLPARRACAIDSVPAWRCE